ncbi:elongator complex protein 2 [Fistulifera solaris]|uniref:Elongator complex protein 2 n=1 Tax=Fistulifera solaris TaxID=1519565 RepID=A0A1Z5JU12_FISSO|nr:elongator complex protein 2 [Fistulifera solaris]|eukprot:GAX17525.1 elongator complex protein 2 [Fistulifera solaris]
MAEISGPENSTHSPSFHTVHQGAAASSFRHAVDWIRGNDNGNDTLVYASNALIYLAERRLWKKEEPVWTVRQTLRSSFVEQNPVLPGDQRPVISAMSVFGRNGIACGFSNGTIAVWIRSESLLWKEHVLSTASRSIGSICPTVHPNTAEGNNNTETLFVLAGTSAGATLYTCHISTNSLTIVVQDTVSLLDSAVCSCSFQQHHSSLLALIGTANPRHNKIWVYRLDGTTPHLVGTLSGHEDWITSMDWWHSTEYSLLASASQDARIRLWMFRTYTEKVTSVLDDTVPDDMEDPDDDLSEGNKDGVEEDEEGESRIEFAVPNASQNSNNLVQHVTKVTLEALLVGHEESVTCVKWHTNPQPMYGYDKLLISSSMDRAIMLWGPTLEGIWTPLTRVGSAGGILGGSVGSSLLGYCGATINPSNGRYLVGQAYGGSLHIWTSELISQQQEEELNSLPLEERASFVRWKATPCITGHFGGITDLCWETSQGEYLLTVSNDQTCRLWAPIEESDKDSIWVELARPQVHGYNLTSIASISSVKHKHLMVTGAEEKELRVFDAPRTTLCMLQTIHGEANSVDDDIERVDRAFIPSLGLSNKASAADRAEEADAMEGEGGSDAFSLTSVKLPLERDLGVASLWPETRKLFGHNTELFCLTSTLMSRTASPLYEPKTKSFFSDVLVASSCKARDAEAASVRLWDVEAGKCAQTLSGGHKSTVATLSFSPDGQFLVSSGKDRRLCLWKRTGSPGKLFELSWSKDTAHKRIIWSVDFCPYDETILTSGSRDGCIKVWKIDTQDLTTQVTELCQFAPSFKIQQKPDSVTALAFAPIPVHDDRQRRGVIAVGLESGRIELFEVPTDSLDDTPPRLVLAFPPDACHIDTVTKLAWQPLRDTAQTKLLLASSSMDWGCRICEISF